MAKTIDEVVSKDIKDMPFEERARAYEAEIKPIIEKWGVTPWAGLQHSPEMLASVPMLKDLWPKEQDA